MESLGCPEDSAGCWLLVVVVLVVVAMFFRLSDTNTGTAFLIHVIVNQSQQLQKVQKKHRFCRPFLFVA